MTLRLAVLASGSGSNLQAILDACACRRIDAEVVAVVSDRPEARALERATTAGVGLVQCLARSDGQDRREWDRGLADVVASASPDWVVLAGFMRVLSSAFLDRFANRVVNLHPALPGELPGTRAIERAFTEFQGGHRTRTGVMVHLVPDEGVDNGPVLAAREVPMFADDTIDTLAARMHENEHQLLVETLARLTEEVPA